MSSGLSDLWRWFADTQCGAYSPLYQRICRAVADDDEVLGVVADAPPHAHLPNMLLAAVHYLVLGGLEHPLSQVYAGASEADPGPLFVEVCLDQREAIAGLLQTRHTNTNEVGRSAALGPALTQVAMQLGQPLGLLDIGCSAGLNLLCDRYLLDYGPAGSTGPPDAAVRVRSEVRGGHPPIARRLPAIAARLGLDRSPVDLSSDDAVQWQLALVWPDTGRLKRTRLAFAEARRSPPEVVEGDAVDDLAAAIDRIPEGCTPVVVTTWAFAYLPVERRAEFANVLDAVSSARRLAWVSAEGPGVVDAFGDVDAPADEGNTPSLLGLVVFTDGRRDEELLAFVHPHGSWIDWGCAPK